jgi:uncharacterized protein (TIGR00255 family)
MRSMTGYGRGESHHAGVKYTVELNSVNRKQADIVVDLPRDLIELEPRIRDEINTVVSRGRLNVVVACHRANGSKDAEVRLDEPLAKAYLKGIQKLRKNLKLNGQITMESVLRCPGVLKLHEAEIDPDEIWSYIEKALKKALTGLLKMRGKEGHYIRLDLLERLGLIAKGVDSIRKLAPASIERYRLQLHERIKNSGIEISLNDERLLKEIAIFADRSDISEELTRLESHLVQFQESLNTAEPVGRALDFLSQEMNREVNTVGSKASHATISQMVISMKSELERIREQIQNVE